MTMYYIHIEETTMGANDGGFSEAMSLCQNRFTPALYRNRQTTVPCIIKASEMLVAPRISEYFLKSLKF